VAQNRTGSRRTRQVAAGAGARRERRGRRRRDRRRYHRRRWGRNRRL